MITLQRIGCVGRSDRFRCYITDPHFSHLNENENGNKSWNLMRFYIAITIIVPPKKTTYFLQSLGSARLSMAFGTGSPLVTWCWFPWGKLTKRYGKQMVSPSATGGLSMSIFMYCWYLFCNFDENNLRSAWDGWFFCATRCGDTNWIPLPLYSTRSRPV